MGREDHFLNVHGNKFEYAAILVHNLVSKDLLFFMEMESLSCVSVLCNITSCEIPCVEIKLH